MLASSPSPPQHRNTSSGSPKKNRPLKQINYIPTKELTYETPGPGSILQFTYGKIELPIDPNSVVIKVKTAALNPFDIKMKNSQLMWAIPGDKGIGKDYCGEIVEVGENLRSAYNIGDYVCGMYLKQGSGTIRSHIVVNPKTDRFAPQPSNLTYAEAAAWPLTFGTAYLSLAHVNFKNYDYSSILILGGTTAVGIMAIQLAKRHFMIDNVVVTCSHQGEELSVTLGADKCINYREDQNGDLSDYIEREAPNKKKFDLILDCIGGNEIFNICDKILEPSKNGSAFVTLVGDNKSNFEALGGPAGYFYQPSMIGRKLFGGLWGMNYISQTVSHGDWIDLGVELLQAGKIKVIIDSEYDWIDFQKAIGKLVSNHARGKIILRIENFA